MGVCRTIAVAALTGLAALAADAPLHAPAAQTTIIRPTLPADGLARRQPGLPGRVAPRAAEDPAFEDLFAADPEARKAADEQARADGWRVRSARSGGALEPVGDPADAAWDGAAETNAEGLAGRYEPDPLVAIGETLRQPNQPIDPDAAVFAGGEGDPAAAGRAGQRTAEELEEVAPEPDPAAGQAGAI